MKFKGKIKLLILLVSILPLFFSFIVFSVIERININHESIERIKSTEAMVHTQLERNLMQQIELLSLIANQSSLLESLTLWNHTNNDVELNKVRKILHDTHNLFKQFKTIGLFSTTNQLLVSVGEPLTYRMNQAVDTKKITKQTRQMSLAYNGQHEVVLRIKQRLNVNLLYSGMLIIDVDLTEVIPDVSLLLNLGDTAELLVTGLTEAGDKVVLSLTKQLGLKTLSETPLLKAANTPLAKVMTSEVKTLGWRLVIKAGKKDFYTHQQPTLMLFFLLVLVLLTFGAAQGVSRFIIHPIKNLRLKAQSIIAGDLSVRLDQSAPDEIGRLGQTLNIMTEALVNTQKELEISVRNISAQNAIITADARRFECWKNSNFIGIIHSKSNGEIVDVNDAFLVMLGYSKDDVKEGVLNWTDLTPSEHLYKDDNALVEAQLKGYWTPFEKEYFHKSGHKVPILIGGAIFSDNVSDADDADEFIVFVVDLTKQKQSDEKIKQQEMQLHRSTKMDALDQLTGGISHDYNNILGVILLYAELVLSFLDKETKLHNYVSQIYKAAERASILTKKLLSHTKVAQMDASAVDINKVLLNEEFMLQKAITQRISLSYHLADGLWPVWMDCSELEDAILNLCINAMHAIESNGGITITTRNVILDESNARAYELQSGQYVQLSCKDTGCGIKAELLDKVLEPYFTTKGAKGTGLGLSQIYGMVRRAKGGIGISSVLGVYTQVNIILPRSEQSVDVEENKSNQVADSFKLGSSSTILIVDDEPQLANIIEEILLQHQLKVIKAQSAKEALEILHSEDISLMITDVIMAQMNGFELSCKALKLHPSLKIQLMSGYNDMSMSSNVDPILIKNMLYKPFKPKELLQRVKSQLEQ